MNIEHPTTDPGPEPDPLTLDEVLDGLTERGWHEVQGRDPASTRDGTFYLQPDSSAVIWSADGMVKSTACAGFEGVLVDGLHCETLEAALEQLDADGRARCADCASLNTTALTAAQCTIYTV